MLRFRPIQLPAPIDEQKKVQSFANRFRTAADYDERLRVTGSDFSIREYLEERLSRGRLKWVDVPCGLGVALHQAAVQYGPRLEAVGVDLIRWDESNVNGKDLQELRRRFEPAEFEALLSKRTFRFIEGDMAEAAFDGADFITAMCGLYYHENPLGVWEHLFNQLRPGGTLVAHFMYPKSSRRVEENYARMAFKLKGHAETELRFSDDVREVREASLVTLKTDSRRLSLGATVRSVKPYTAAHGLNGKFQIKVVDYDLKPA